MTKRKKINDFIESDSKKQKCDFISASSIKNYMNKDPIIDFLSYWHINELNQKPDRNRIYNNSEKSEFLNHLFDNGIKFENDIYEKIKENHDIIQVFKNINDLNIENYELTKKYISEGINIIYQGVLYNIDNNTYGVADLLVRSDYINILVPNTINVEEEKINNKYYYFAIDIKNSTIELNKDGIYVLNSKNLPFYKVQLLIYTEALSNILGVKITKAFILGRKYHWGQINYETNNFLKLGLIDYKNIDFKYYDYLNDSINWIKKLRTNGDKWKLLPKPSVEELYPNMKNTYDLNYRKIKKELSENIGELTQIWNVGVKFRKFAHKNGIYSWKNNKCNSKTLGFNNNSSIGFIVDKIIKINRSNKNIEPKKISYNINNWKICPSDTLEFYIDYETLIYNEKSFIFMIGIGYEDNGWKFKNFHLKQLSNENMNIMIHEFWDFVKQILKQKHKNESRFIHWTKAEPSQYYKCVNKLLYPYKNFIDLFDVFKKEPIVIKGAFSFSLKDIAKAMYNNKMISSCWSCVGKTSINCENGQDALIWGLKLYEQNNIITDDNIILKSIRDYNEIDCKVMFEIITYLRNNHI